MEVSTSLSAEWMGRVLETLIDWQGCPKYICMNNSTDMLAKKNDGILYVSLIPTFEVKAYL